MITLPELSFGAASLEGHHYVAPINRVPNDVLADVFQELVNEDRYQPGEKPFQLILGQICCRWRGLVLNLPLLWTQLRISMRVHPQFVRLFLRRSKDVPLDIFMVEEGWRGTSTGVYNILHNLIPHSWRWRRLVVHAYGIEIIHCVLHHLTNIHAPRLECIDLRTASSFHHDEVLSYPFLTMNTFSLRSVQFHGFRPPSALFSDRLACLDLTNTSIHDTSEFCSLLCASAELRHLRIENVSGISNDKLEKRVVTIPSLLSLDVEMMDTLTVFVFLFAISAKSLAFLRLARVDLNYPHGLHRFQDTCTHEPKFPGLHTLVLIFTQLPETMPITFYRGTSNVRHLMLENSGSSILNDIEKHSQQCMPDEGPLWPHLQMLSITNQISFVQLRNVLAARLAIGLPIAHIRLWELAMYANNLKLGLGVKIVECVRSSEMMSDFPPNPTRNLFDAGPIVNAFQSEHWCLRGYHGMAML
jgi:hypothetical protein